MIVIGTIWGAVHHLIAEAAKYSRVTCTRSRQGIRDGKMVALERNVIGHKRDAANEVVNEK